MDSASRREVLRAGLMWGGVSFLGPVATLVERMAAQGCDAGPLGELLGTLPLHGDRQRQTPFAQVVGGPGLDARVFTDLSRLQPDRLITPAAEMFVRTEAPRGLRPAVARWTIAAQGFKAAETLVSVESLRREATPMGAHLIECSGNVDPDNFGLMSVTEWSGVPLARVIAGLGRRAGATGVLVSGLDHETASASSAPGASWILNLDTLDELGAFLAVEMNGEPLTLDHGAPVRLVVPGWYGCGWIKWVNELRLIGPEAPSTTQMLEFSRRTHQDGLPTLARDYQPPAIDLAATPIRVEKRRVDGRLEYRIVGIVWGGDRPVDKLMIRFNAGAPAFTVPICPAPRSHRTWSLWDYRWRPTAPGIYNIVLKATDSSIRTRRLDVSFYLRRVIIEEV